MGAAAADYNNDGYTDLYVTNFGSNVLYHNNGDGTFSDITATAGVSVGSWSTGAAWGDYDKDGDLDLYVARYVNFDRETVPAKGSSKFCKYKGLAVMCGPRGLDGLTDVLFQNNGDGTFSDVTKHALGAPPEFYGFTPLWGDFDNDGWPDLYVANDGTPSLLYHNQRDGTFEEMGIFSGAAYSADGREQAGMGVDIGDYDRDGLLDLLKTNFSDDHNNLYQNQGQLVLEDVVERAKLSAVSWNQLGWAAKFVDFDLDGWLDIFIANGHVYPEVRQWEMDSGYRQAAQVFRNLGDGTFAEVTARSGSDLMLPRAGRGAGFGDLDNDGDIDIVMNNLDGPATILRCRSPDREWITLHLVGTRSNRDAVGARVVVKTEATGEDLRTYEVTRGGGFLSSNDPRIHVGLGNVNSARQITVSWPSGLVQKFQDLPSRRIYKIREGESSTGSERLREAGRVSALQKSGQ